MLLLSASSVHCASASSSAVSAPPERRKLSNNYSSSSSTASSNSSSSYTYESSNWFWKLLAHLGAPDPCKHPHVDKRTGKKHYPKHCHKTLTGTTGTSDTTVTTTDGGDGSDVTTIDYDSGTDGYSGYSDGSDATNSAEANGWGDGDAIEESGWGDDGHDGGSSSYGWNENNLDSGSGNSAGASPRNAAMNVVPFIAAALVAGMFGAAFVVTRVSKVPLVLLLLRGCFSVCNQPSTSHVDHSHLRFSRIPLNPYTRRSDASSRTNRRTPSRDRSRSG